MDNKNTGIKRRVSGFQNRVFLPSLGNGSTYRTPSGGESILEVFAEEPSSLSSYLNT